MLLPWVVTDWPQIRDQGVALSDTLGPTDELETERQRVMRLNAFVGGVQEIEESLLHIVGISDEYPLGRCEDRVNA